MTMKWLKRMAKVEKCYKWEINGEGIYKWECEQYYTFCGHLELEPYEFDIDIWHLRC